MNYKIWVSGGLLTDCRETAVQNPGPELAPGLVPFMAFIDPSSNIPVYWYTGIRLLKFIMHAESIGEFTAKTN